MHQYVTDSSIFTPPPCAQLHSGLKRDSTSAEQRASHTGATQLRFDQRMSSPLITERNGPMEKDEKNAQNRLDADNIGILEQA